MTAPAPVVLVADDDELVRRIVLRTLERAGFQVIAAADGEEALLLLREVHPDVLLLDIVMPGLDGYEVCRRVRAAGPTAPPVIFLTSRASTEERVVGLDSGAVDYVVKPFDPLELVARVRAAIRTKSLVDTLAESAGIDGLTGLLNRGQLDVRLGEAIAFACRYGKPLSCAMVDLDDFKLVNDRLGHAAGDECLQAVSRLLRNAVRGSDVVGRYGGDEFVLLLPDTDVEGACALGEKLLRLLAALAAPVPVRASVGVAQWDAEMSRPDELFRAADRALYRAKRRGRNRVAAATPTDLDEPAEVAL